jgi:hypothetical protein
VNRCSRGRADLRDSTVLLDELSEEPLARPTASPGFRRPSKSLDRAEASLDRVDDRRLADPVAVADGPIGRATRARTSVVRAEDVEPVVGQGVAPVEKLDEVSRGFDISDQHRAD